jgi:Amidohydrolase
MSDVKLASEGSLLDERALIISSDGHASAQMEDYRPYLPPEYLDEFDAFYGVYKEKGSRNFEPKNLVPRLDQEVVDDWVDNVLDAGRTAGLSDPGERISEMESQGVVAEIVFPDFGLPFELYSPQLAVSLGFTCTDEQVEAGNWAYNRWLADFCSLAPDRFAGMAVMSFSDVNATLNEIRWAKKVGLRGVVLPSFDESIPLFDERFEPVWSLLEDLEMPVNSHIGISSTTKRVPAAAAMSKVSNSACARPIFGAQFFFFCQQILNQMIWGGVLQRHPKLQVVFTEVGSGWVIDALEGMDYSYEGSFLRRDIRDLLELKPSEYFQRQCHLGRRCSHWPKPERAARLALIKSPSGWIFRIMKARGV